MEIWELENIIHDLQIKLDYLTQRKENNHYQAYGTDVKYEYGETTVGTKKEIEETKKQIAQYQEALQKKKANEKKRKMEQKPEFRAMEAEIQKRQEEYQKKQELEQKRLETFKRVKEAYKKRKGHGFKKIMDRLSGNGPKWKNVSQYTQEELDFVLRSLEGKTINRELATKRVEEQSLSYKETRKAIKKGNWDNFIKLLHSKGALRQTMRNEETLEKGHIL